ncbi:MurR/RpiR family transcriptional regulator [Anaerovibrio sp.]|uniref:MurR/RpiR family transcriptional regulator n=1 Tax=Anaerovibrio sp. TaxID=1872532 RepID=UPI003F13CEA5
MSRLIRALKAQDGFSDSEKEIAGFLLENYRSIAAMSTRQLAQLTYTSASTIVRFTKRMGFEGYTEFKVRFLTEMMEYVNENRQDDTFTNKDTVRILMEKVACMERSAIKETHMHLEPVLVVKAVKEIIEAEHVDFYATDDNVQIANLAAVNLSMADKGYTLPMSISQMYLTSSRESRRHVGFVISRTGENRMLIDVAKNLKAHGGRFILITGTPDSTLGRMADVVLPVVTASTLEELWTRVFWIGSQYVIDVIFAALLSRKGFKAVGERERWLRSHFHY